MQLERVIIKVDGVFTVLEVARHAQKIGYRVPEKVVKYMIDRDFIILDPNTIARHGDGEHFYDELTEYFKPMSVEEFTAYEGKSEVLGNGK